MKELKSGREKQLIFSPRLGRLITPGESTKIMSEHFIKSGLTSKLKVLWTEVSINLRVVQIILFLNQCRKRTDPT